ncbi:hypothetical protein IV203_017117 [Nitzschia inconspicua]|uniref:Uncharacterized protein n=1 Tax=Nitzschia inconspicua TaxID=303405 RepID=A0A9K3KRX7_9STRA|nr:hypothetical protein IV203_017117 [Nitzschia inconspicua]
MVQSVIFASNLEVEEKPLLGGPPLKKQRTFSPASLADFHPSMVLLSQEQGGQPLRDGIEDDEDNEEFGMDCSPCFFSKDLSMEMLLAEYLTDSVDDKMIQTGLGLLWGRLGGGEFASSVTLSIRQQREEVLRLGGHWVLTNLMGQYEENPSIQIQCCSILTELMWEGGATRYQVYCAGGMDKVIGAMERCPENVHLQLSGCQFLSRLVLAPVSTTILEAVVRSSMGLRGIFRLLHRFGTEQSYEGMDPMNKELNRAATSLLYAMVGQCPFGLLAEISQEMKHHRLDSGVSRCLTMMLEDYDSRSVRDEQYVL